MVLISKMKISQLNYTGQLKHDVFSEELSMQGQQVFRKMRATYESLRTLAVVL